MSPVAHAMPAPDSRPEPRARRKLVPDGVLGMLLFVFTESMLFAGLISAHTIAKAGASEWPPFGQPRLPVTTTMFNTVALLASGVTLMLAHRAWRRQRAGAPLMLLLSTILGTFFVLAQGREWVALIREGLTLTSSTYGAYFYLIVGGHALHAVAAIPALAWASLRMRSGRLTAGQFGAVQAFWYFVVLVWPVLYMVVYL